MLRWVSPVCCLQLSGTLFWPDPNPTETLCVCACPRILLLIVLPDRLWCGVNLQVAGVASRVCPVTARKDPKETRKSMRLWGATYFCLCSWMLNFVAMILLIIFNIYDVIFAQIVLSNLSSSFLKFVTCTKIMQSFNHLFFHLLTFEAMLATWFKGWRCRSVCSSATTSDWNV